MRSAQRQEIERGSRTGPGRSRNASGIACRKALLVSALILAAPWLAGAELRLARLFSDHAVFQRDEPVPVWGWADAGREVEVVFAGQTHRAMADPDGRWQIVLDPMPAAAEGRELVARAGSDTRRAVDILVGDVWLASGQANMRLGGIPQEDHPLVRHFNVEAAMAPVPRDTIRRGRWVPDATGTAAFLSDVAGGFARRLRAELGVPVGVIVAARDATTAGNWINREGLELFPGHYAPPQGAELQRQLAVMDVWNARQDEYDQAREQLAAALVRGGTEPSEKQLSAALRWLEEALRPRYPWPEDNAKIYNMVRSADACAYNGMIAPLIPYRIRGVIWYQGEWDGGAATRAYFYRFAPLIAGWRLAWRQGAFPFLYVQTHNVGEGELPPSESSWSRYAGVREAQRLALQLPATGMAVSFDLCRGMHPDNRDVPAERLARWALAYVYGREDITPSGPLYHSAVQQGSRMRVRFRNAGGGLVLRDRADGAESPFWISAQGGRFMPAEAAVDGEDLLVWHPLIQLPVAARYAWNAEPEAVLFNSDGLPASPFATDVFYPADFTEARARQAAYKDALRRRHGGLDPLPAALPPITPVPAVPRDADE